MHEPHSNALSPTKQNGVEKCGGSLDLTLPGCLLEFALINFDPVAINCLSFRARWSTCVILFCASLHQRNDN